MEFWQFCFIIIGLAENWIRSYGVIDFDQSNYCERSFLKEPFPVRHVPVKWQFRLILQETTGSDILLKERLCLEESYTLTLSPCDANNFKQMWFQYESYLINMQSGLAVIPQAFREGTK